MKHDVIVIGAGATGLMAGKILSEKGKKVLILEARNRTGGRIHTLYSDSLPAHKEAGAEFVHGKLPLTLALLREAGLAYYASSDEMWQSDEEGLHEEYAAMEGWDVLMKKLKELKEDISIDTFLEKYLPGEEYKELRTSTKNYAQGYDTADTDRASALALRDEWTQEGAQHTYRPEEGYGRMIAYLEMKIRESGGSILLSSIVSGITMRKGEAKISTTDGMVYGCKKVIVTVPIGILRSGAGTRGHITFTPELPIEYREAIEGMGYGSVIKILLEFNKRFWEGDKIRAINGKAMDNAAFIFSEASIPTWWLQSPKKSGLLTGWVGGPKAAAMSGKSNEELFNMAIRSLSEIFSIEEGELKSMLVDRQIFNWTNEPFTLGSYSYPTVGVNKYRMTMAIPIADTLYFAGEAIWQGSEAGTIEAALGSGRAVAESIIALDKQVH